MIYEVYNMSHKEKRSVHFVSGNLIQRKKDPFRKK